jgi:hypothetical protein
MRSHNFIISLAAACMLLASCANTYEYCQICETKPIQKDSHLKIVNGKLDYENSQCVIEYNFWSNGGKTDFYFHNKTDEIIYIDLAKSFFVMNGVAYDLYRGREWSQSSSVGIAQSTSYGYSETYPTALIGGVIVPSLAISSGKAIAHAETNTVNIKEKQIIAVPPHSKKYVETYNITVSSMVSCDLQRYPSNNAKLDFTAENSPYRFSNVITYAVGDTAQSTTITNEFYVSAVTNYAEPEIVVMKKREDICENMRDPDYKAPNCDLFDKVIRDSICETVSSFYNTYSTTTGKKLYKDNTTGNYTYNSQYHAYTKTNTGGKTSSLKVFGFLAGFMAVILIASILRP